MAAMIRPAVPGDAQRAPVIRAGIVGLGRWGRALVGAVAGKSDDIRFVLAATRTPRECRRILPRKTDRAGRKL